VTKREERVRDAIDWTCLLVSRQQGTKKISEGKKKDQREETNKEIFVEERKKKQQ
jgi:hypothetical protein